MRKNGNRVRTCREFPRVWAAIYGCEGKARTWRYDTDALNRRHAIGSCDTCWAVREAHAKLDSVQEQEALRAAQAAAGVADYRYQASARDKRTGKPYLVFGSAPTAGQVSYLDALARRTGYMSTAQAIEDVIGVGTEELTREQASEAIGKLRSRA